MTQELMTWALAAAGGGLIGFLLASFGGGGSVLAAPFLLYVVGVTDPHVAIGTSAAAVAVNAAASLAAQARAGRVKWPCATAFAVAGLAGALTGAQLARHVDGRALLGLFAAAMALVAASMLAPRRSEGDPTVHLTPALVAKLAPLGLLSGLAAGFFGIGGGFLIAPGLMAATGMTLANAAASSLLSVALFGAATSVSYAAAGQVAWPLVAAMIAGGAVGIVAAQPAAKALSTHAALARRLFAMMILATAAYVGWRAWRG